MLRTLETSSSLIVRPSPTAFATICLGESFGFARTKSALLMVAAAVVEAFEAVADFELAGASVDASASVETVGAFVEAGASLGAFPSVSPASGPRTSRTRDSVIVSPWAVAIATTTAGDNSTGWF